MLLPTSSFMAKVTDMACPCGKEDREVQGRRGLQAPGHLKPLHSRPQLHRPESYDPEFSEPILGVLVTTSQLSVLYGSRIHYERQGP